MTKKLQIVRVDNDLVQKANLQIGNNIIGRGAATGCNDGQVLKHAVTINLSPNDEMTISPVVPCYMKQAGCTRWQFLKLGSSVPIKPGDVCSLLPDKCWFKVISVSDTKMEENDQILKRKADENLSNEVNSKKACLSSNVEVIISPSETLNDTHSDKNPSNEHQNSSINENSEHNDDNAGLVLQEINSANSLEGSNMPATCSKISTDTKDIIEPCVAQQNDKQKAKNVNLTSETITNVEEGKKIKWDCNTHFSDQTESQASPTQNNPDSPVITLHQDQANGSSNQVNPVRVARERCMYGARCYRKNPNHKNNYSHPADSDYDEVDNREECPYGIKCYRKNPQHKMQFKHTRVSHRRRRAATPMHSVIVDTTFETDHSSTEESVDESDYEPSMYTESSDDLDESRSEWEDGTTG